MPRRSAAAGRIGQLEHRVGVAVRDRLLRATPDAIATRQAAAITAHDPIGSTVGEAPSAG